MSRTPSRSSRSRDCVQSFTYTFALERAPAARTIAPARPEKYEHYRDTQPYSLTIEVHGGEIYGEESGWLSYRLFEQMPGTKGPLWTYRRLIDAAALPRVSGTRHHDVQLAGERLPRREHPGCSRGAASQPRCRTPSA